jgi:hypothetical protein
MLELSFLGECVGQLDDGLTTACSISVTADGQSDYGTIENHMSSRCKHPTCWTRLVAKAIQLFGFPDPERALQIDKEAAVLRSDSSGRCQLGRPIQEYCHATETFWKSPPKVA